MFLKYFVTYTGKKSTGKKYGEKILEKKDWKKVREN